MNRDDVKEHESHFMRNSISPHRPEDCHQEKNQKRKGIEEDDNDVTTCPPMTGPSTCTQRYWRQYMDNLHQDAASLNGRKTKPSYPVGAVAVRRMDYDDEEEVMEEISLDESGTVARTLVAEAIMEDELRQHIRNELRDEVQEEMEARIFPGFVQPDADKDEPSVHLWAKKRVFIGAVLLLLTIAGITVGAVVATKKTVGDDVLVEEWYQKGQTLVGGAKDDLFGFATAISGDGTVLAIGAAGVDINEETNHGAGYAKVFRFNANAGHAGQWDPLGSILIGQGEALEMFGESVAISRDGTVVAVGGRGYNDESQGLEHVGQIRIYEWDGSDWQQVGHLTGPRAHDYFGYSVTLSGDASIVAGGTMSNDDSGENSGTIRAYQRSGDNQWQQIGSELSGDIAEPSLELSSDGRTLIVGSPQPGNSGPGFVRVYQFDGTEWRQVGQELTGAGQGDQFGEAVAISGDGRVVASGAPYYDDPQIGDDAGQVELFWFTDNTWNPFGSPIVGSSVGGAFGAAIKLTDDGKTLVVGAHDASSNGNSRVGQVSVCTWNGSDWEQLGQTLDGRQSGDVFGFAVAISSDAQCVAVGAPTADGNGMVNSGEVNLFALL